jgi:mitogen-activated protein kinase kinase kinase
MDPLNSPGVHDHNSRLRHQKSVPSIDGGGIMSIDSVRQVSLSFSMIDPRIARNSSAKTGRRVSSISVIVPPQEQSSTKSSRNSISKTIQITGVSSSPKIAEAVSLSYHPFLTVDSRLSDAELLQYCHDPNIPERERLILTKRNATPGGAELRRAQAIAKEQQLAAQEKLYTERKEKLEGANSLGRTKTNKLEGFFGERPTSFQRPPSGSPPSHNGSPRDQTRPNTKRLRNFFGQRPPSELISSNLAEYFPDHEKNLLEETVRNSIRRSTRMSQAGGRRFSTATTASTASSRDKDIPPLPTMGDAWKEAVSGAGAMPNSNTRLAVPRVPTRPISLRRALSTASYTNSIVESLNEDDDEEDKEAEKPQNDLSALESEGGDTLRPSTLSSVSPTTIESSESKDDEEDEEDEEEEEEEEEEEDSEEEYEEGEFDAVGGGPTRWIRGALIGMGSFGSVYLGMNRTSGELMAVKQVELPSHEVQGEQRKQSMLIALQREIALLRDLTHENIVHYIGIPPMIQRTNFEAPVQTTSS